MYIAIQRRKLIDYPVGITQITYHNCDIGSGLGKLNVTVNNTVIIQVPLKVSCMY